MRLKEFLLLSYSIRRRDGIAGGRDLDQVPAPVLDAVARAEKAREAIEDEVLSSLSAEDRRTLRRILVRALAGRPRTPAPSRS